MAELILMPRLSDTMEEGTVVKWHKNTGDPIAEGDIIAEIETDKAIQEFESEFDGILLYQGVAEGNSVPIDSPLAIIGKEGEDFQSLIDGNKGDESAKENTEKLVKEHTATTEIPKGVQTVYMPRLSDTMETGTVAQWHKKTGDPVAEGDIIAEIETDKAVQEFESEYEGTLLYIGVKEGETVPIDAVLAIIGPAGTEISAIIEKESSAPKEKTILQNSKTVEENSEVSTTLSGEITEGINTGDRIFISPLAKKIAAEKGFDISKIKGTGDHGRIIKKDVENFVPVQIDLPAATSPTTISMVPAGKTIETPISQMRKVIAKRLSESKFTAPHYYLTIEIDMEQAIASRKAINAMPDTKVSYNDLIIKACASALKKHLSVNTTWADDKIITHGDINIGVAVAVADGLLVPVVHHADSLQLTQIASKVKELAIKAKDRKLSAEEMSGSTFTVSNLGMFGIESFTSIINAPNSCILSVGTIVEKPVVKEGKVIIGNTMKVTLAADHRTVDGALGAAFLQTLKTMIENPVTILA